VLDLLFEYGINHIDTAPMYGKAEERIGPWLEKHRDQFFIATKTRSRSAQGAWKNLHRSLKRLKVDQVDLWQMHGLTNPAGWNKAMGPGGTLEAFLEAREKGLVRYLGVTAHGTKAAKMHLQSLDRFEFDAVMLPFNYTMMQNPRYAADFNQLIERCRKRNVAVQTIKSVARRPWKGRPKTHNTYFYEPLTNQNAIDHAVHWALGLEDSFLVSAGDVQILPKKFWQQRIVFLDDPLRIA
jgi:aryl-alcohol dehydrogenase-like predicted oxidoreductase